MEYIQGRYTEQWLSTLPEHWTKRTLGDVVKLHYGRRLHEQLRTDKPTDTHTIPVYSSGGLLGYTGRAVTKAPVIIVGRVGTIGRPKYVEKPCYPIDTVFYATSSLHPRYAFYLLSSIDYDYYSQYSVIPAVRRSTLYRIPVGIAPKEEQALIADTLDGIVPPAFKNIQVMEQQIEKYRQLTSLLVHQLLQGK